MRQYEPVRHGHKLPYREALKECGMGDIFGENAVWRTWMVRSGREWDCRRR